MKKLALFIPFVAIAFPAFAQKAKTEVSRVQYQINTQSFSSQIVDTALAGSQKHYPLVSSLNSWSELGNTGLPALINEYRPIRDALNPLMFEGCDAYGTNRSDLVFYSANSPFSLINYNSGGTEDKNGQTIRALFGRNLKRNGNFTFLGNYSNSNGHFNRQVCNSSGIQVNYILKRENYNLITGLSRYSFKFNENGGIKSDEQLKNAYLTNYIPVNLSDAATKMSVLTWQGVQTALIHFGGHSGALTPADSIVKDSIPEPKPSDSLRQLSPGSRFIRIAHSFRISSVSRRYSDTNADSAFYLNTYSEDESMSDSMKFLSWINDISLLSDTLYIGKYPALLKGGINPDFYRYQYADIVTYGYSLGVNGKISIEKQYNHAEVKGNWVAAGYPAGDYHLEANYSLIPGKKVNGSEISFKLYASGCSADPVIQQYQSNHFRWSNDFSRQYESGVDVKWDVTAIRTALTASLVTTKGRIYFDTLGMPAQDRNQMTVFSVKGSKDFTAGVLRSSVSALVQYSTSDIIRLPEFVGSTSTYIHHDILFPATKGKLEVEYGFDLNFTSGFYGYAYMPATGIFYVENEKVLSNYPCLNIFAQMKLKRTRLFIAWCQTFSDLLPDQSFAVLHYPSMRPHLKFGIYWHFYD